MRPIHIAKLDKSRPVLVLTRETVRPNLRRVTVAPITSTIRGLAVEVLVGIENGVANRSAVNLDNIRTIDVSDLGRQIGFLLPEQEGDLAGAIYDAFNLSPLRRHR